MKLLVVLLLVATVLAKKRKSDSGDKVKIAVYYEALCPDSMSFITRQLYPAWKTMHGTIKVKLIPYGKAIQNRRDDVWEFECQHGPRECYGNKVQGCVLKNKEINDEMKFDIINCMMADKHPDNAFTECAARLRVNGERVQECADSTRGDDILAYYGNRTAELVPPLSFVPTVVFNEKFDQTNTNEAMQDLRGVICRLAKRKPALCP